MTVSLRPTAARLALLQAVADGEVTCSRLFTNGKVRAQHRPAEGLGRDVTNRIDQMEGAGWVKRGRAASPSMYARRPIELTAAGRQILNQHAKETSQ